MAGLTGAGGCTDLRKEKREQREERGNEKKREKVSDEMRGEREKVRLKYQTSRWSPSREIDFLINTKCTVAFHFLINTKCTVHFVKKFEIEECIWTTAGAGFFLLFTTNRDTE